MKILNHSQGAHKHHRRGLCGRRTFVARAMAKLDRLKPLLGAAILTPALLLGAYPAHANPSGGQVVHGQVTISPGVQTQIRQLTEKAIVDWQSFSIGANEAVRFLQPGQGSVILNRVLGADPSTILGRLDANGSVFLINPNGILFGPGAMVNVGGLVASTLNITNEDFLAGRYSFIQDPNSDLAAVVNQGQITINDAGFAVLTGPGVVNEGTILARTGTVALAAGEKTTLNLDGRDLVHFALEGDITPGAVTLAPGMVSDALSQALGVHASERADRLVRMPDGSVQMASSSGTLVQAGTIKADGIAGQRAGRVQIDSSELTILADGSLTSANGEGMNSNGGEVLILSDKDQSQIGYTDLQTGALIEAKGGLSGDGGFIEVSADVVNLDGDIDASAENGDWGDFLLDPITVRIIFGGVAPPAGNPIVLTTSTDIDHTFFETLMANTTVQSDGDIIFDVVGTRPAMSTDTGIVFASAGPGPSLTFEAGRDLAEGGEIDLNQDAISNFSNLTFTTNGNINFDRANLDNVGNITATAVASPDGPGNILGGTNSNLRTQGTGHGVTFNAANDVDLQTANIFTNNGGVNITAGRNVNFSNSRVNMPVPGPPVPSTGDLVVNATGNIDLGSSQVRSQASGGAVPPPPTNVTMMAGGGINFATSLLLAEGQVNITAADNFSIDAAGRLTDPDTVASLPVDFENPGANLTVTANTILVQGSLETRNATLQAREIVNIDGGRVSAGGMPDGFNPDTGIRIGIGGVDGSGNSMISGTFVDPPTRNTAANVLIGSDFNIAGLDGGGNFDPNVAAPGHIDANITSNFEDPLDLDLSVRSNGNVVIRERSYDVIDTRATADRLTVNIERSGREQPSATATNPGIQADSLILDVQDQVRIGKAFPPTLQDGTTPLIDVGGNVTINAARIDDNSDGPTAVLDVNATGTVNFNVIDGRNTNGGIVRGVGTGGGGGGTLEVQAPGVVVKGLTPTLSNTVTLIGNLTLQPGTRLLHLEADNPQITVNDTMGGSLGFGNGTLDIVSSTGTLDATDVFLATTSEIRLSDFSVGAGQEFGIKSSAGSVVMNASTNRVTNNGQLLLIAGNSIGDAATPIDVTGGIVAGQALQSINLDSQGSVTAALVNIEDASGAVLVHAGQPVNVPGLQSGTSLDINVRGAGNFVANSSLNAGTNLNVTLNAAGDFNAAASLQAGQTASVTLLGDGNAQFQNSVDGNGPGGVVVNLRGVGNLTTAAAAPFNAPNGDLALTTNQGNISTQGSLTTGQNLTATAGGTGNLNLQAPANATANVNLSTTGTGSVLVQNMAPVQAGADVQVNSRGDFTVSDNITAGGSFTSDATNTTTVNATVQAQDATLDSASLGVGGSVNGNTTVDINAGDVSVGGQVSAGNTVTINSGPIDISGMVNGGQVVDLNINTGNLTNTGMVQAAGDGIAITLMTGSVIGGTGVYQGAEIGMQVNGNVGFFDGMATTTEVIVDTANLAVDVTGDVLVRRTLGDLTIANSVTVGGETFTTTPGGDDFRAVVVDGGLNLGTDLMVGGGVALVTGNTLTVGPQAAVGSIAIGANNITATGNVAVVAVNNITGTTGVITGAAVGLGAGGQVGTTTNPIQISAPNQTVFPTTGNVNNAVTTTTVNQVTAVGATVNGGTTPPPPPPPGTTVVTVTLNSPLDPGNLTNRPPSSLPQNNVDLVEDIVKGAITGGFLGTIEDPDPSAPPVPITDEDFQRKKFRR